MPRHARAAKRSDPLLQLPGQVQPCEQMPMPASNTDVQQARGGSSADPTSHVLPPPEKEFLLLQSVLMPANEATPASAPGRQLDEGMYAEEDKEEIIILDDPPNAEQPPRQSKPDQPAQQCSEPAGQPPSQHACAEENTDSEAAYARAEMALRGIFSDPAPQQALGEQTSITCLVEGLRAEPAFGIVHQSRAASLPI